MHICKKVLLSAVHNRPRAKYLWIYYFNVDCKSEKSLVKYFSGAVLAELIYQINKKKGDSVFQLLGG